jgi:hypothetical protein
MICVLGILEIVRIRELPPASVEKKWFFRKIFRK